MSSRYTWTNSDGLQIPSGRRAASENDIPGDNAALLNEKEVKFVIKQGESSDDANINVYGSEIPAGATITDVQLHSDGACTSLVDLIVGVADADGGSDLTDADGLVLAIDAAEVVALRPSGTVVGTDFDGALLTTSLPLTEAVTLTWAATTASSAGDITVLVKYVTAG